MEYSCTVVKKMFLSFLVRSVTADAASVAEVNFTVPEWSQWHPLESELQFLKTKKKPNISNRTSPAGTLGPVLRAFAAIQSFQAHHHSRTIRIHATSFKGLTKALKQTAALQALYRAQY
jgi:hypothetical protein